MDEASMASRKSLKIHVPFLMSNMVSSRENFDLAAIASRPDSALDENARNIASALLEDRSLFQSTIESQTQIITDLLQETQRTVINEFKRELKREFKRSRFLLGVLPKSASTEASSSTTEVAYKTAAEDRILESLLFPSISKRYEGVIEAHANTYKWIFLDPRPEDRPWSSFTDWLKNGNGIYWINGKAGSGKSTLMRYLYEHSLTRELLDKWSWPLDPNLAAFFFWNIGTYEQRSQLGLLRALLHNILSKHRNPIPVALHDRWNDELRNLHHSHFIDVDFEWNLQILRKAFE
jgi:hypothetical protein